LNETLASVLSEYFKTSERSVFWDDSLQKNMNPLTKATPDFFSAEWDVKVGRSCYTKTMTIIYLIPAFHSSSKSFGSW
jgi:hypothetical protein